MQIQGKVFVVTGAGSGMGREISLELTRRKGKVALVDFREESLQETARMINELGGASSTHLLDVSDAKACQLLPAKIVSSLGSVDCLINNAGIIQPFVKINDLAQKDIDHVMAVNFFGPVNLTKAFLPLLLDRPEAHILNVSSMGAYAPVPGQSIYGASKAAVKLFTEGLRSELINTKVGVTIVFPGAVATNIAQNSGMNVSQDAESSNFPTTPADVAARLMVDAIAKNSPRLVIGKDAKTMDILSRINPVYAAKLIYKQMATLLK